MISENSIYVVKIGPVSHEYWAPVCQKERGGCHEWTNIRDAAKPDRI